MADAIGLGPIGSNPVGVQVPSSAPEKIFNLQSLIYIEISISHWFID